eukprot:EC719037.1.p1 GENE.EC719037.1~~EC719037.1.p1  ORF type:complete len:105 (+),score=5.09 EC719037.1:91-405(+)
MQSARFPFDYLIKWIVGGFDLTPSAVSTACLVDAFLGKPSGQENRQTLPAYVLGPLSCHGKTVKLQLWDGYNSFRASKESQKKFVVQRVVHYGNVLFIPYDITE